MQVLKFGGSSVANAENITRVIKIVRQALTKDKTVVVSSAISGCTDALIAIGKAALAQDGGYRSQIENLQNRHISLIEELIPRQECDDIKAECLELFKKLEEICKGVYLLKELSDLSLDHIVSFGELLSTKIISAKLKSMNISHKWKDSRELIKTELLSGKNSVIREVTFRNIKEYFDSNNCSLYILPGFIAMDISFMGLSSAATRLELKAPHLRHLWMIAHSPLFLTHTATGSMIPPQSDSLSPGSISTWRLDRQFGQ